VIDRDLSKRLADSTWRECKAVDLMECSADVREFDFVLED